MQKPLLQVAFNVEAVLSACRGEQVSL